MMNAVKGQTSLYSPAAFLWWSLLLLYTPSTADPTRGRCPCVVPPGMQDVWKIWSWLKPSMGKYSYCIQPPCGWSEHKPGWFTQCEWPPRNTLALLHQTEGYSLLLRYPVTPFHNSPLFVRVKVPAVNYTGHFSPPSSHCPSDKFS